jgi:hypothetical protein
MFNCHTQATCKSSSKVASNHSYFFFVRGLKKFRYFRFIHPRYGVCNLPVWVSALLLSFFFSNLFSYAYSVLL